MKRWMRLLAAVMLLTLCMTTFATAAFAAQKVTAWGDSNIRSGPGLGYAKKGVLYSGSSATYLNSKKKDYRGVAWYKIKYGGKTGWVSSRYTTLGSGYYYDDDDEEYSYSTSGYTKVKTTGKVNVRSGPRLSAYSLGTVSKGTSLKYRGKVSIDSRGVSWYAVYYKGDYGWVSSKYAYLK